jgi:chromosome partitioning protein
MLEIEGDPLDRVVAVINGKGGVGKTSIVANLGALAAAAGYRVLLIDLDPQGNLADDFGYADTDTDDRGAALHLAVVSRQPAQPLTGVRDNLDVLPGGEQTEDLEAVLYARTRRDPDAALNAVAEILAPVADNYDLILLDCPPGGAMLQEAALGAARWLLIPTRSDLSSRKALRSVAQRYVTARTGGARVELLGVVLFGVTSSARNIREHARKSLKEDLAGAAPILETVIRYAEAAADEGRRRGVVAHELDAAKAGDVPWWERLRDPKSATQPLVPGSATSLAADYAALTHEVLTLMSSAENPDPVARQDSEAVLT